MIRYEVGEDRVGRITLDRPEARNALTIEMRDDLVDAVRSARDDAGVRALLVTGTGDSFCSGMDLRASTVASAGGAFLLPRLVGLPRAKAMVLLGDEVVGAEAVELGLAYRCLDTVEELTGVADELAVRLARGPSRSLGLSKQLLNASFETALPLSLDREAHFQALGTVSPEMAEGMAAFKERRPPDFIGSSGSAGD